MTEEYRNIADLVLRNQMTHEGGSLTVVNLCFDMDALQVAALVAARRLADEDGEVILFNFDPELYGSEDEELVTVLESVGDTTVEEAKGHRWTVVQDFEPFFEQIIRTRGDVAAVLMVDPFHHTRGADDTADEQMVVRCQAVAEHMHTHVVLVSLSYPLDCPSVEDLTCWTHDDISMGYRADKWHSLARDLHQAACQVLLTGDDCMLGWSLMKDAAELGSHEASMMYGRALAGKVESGGAVPLDTRKALAVLSVTNDGGGSIREIIYNAIEEIEKAQMESH